MPPVFSVIVPFFNAAPHIRACVEGLLAQDFPSSNYEILMVDNNSTDGSARIVAEYGRIRLLAEPTQGAYVARNLAAATAQGPFLAFTDPDCVPCRGWLSSFANAFADPRTLIGLGIRRPALEGTLLSRVADYENMKDRLVLESDEKTAYYGFANNMTIKREAFDRYGPFLERRRGADTIFVRRVVDADSCDRVVLVPSAEVRHLELASVVTYFRKMLIYGRSRQLYRRVATTRPLSVDERLRVFRETVERHKYSVVARVQLMSVLSLGMAAWTLGSWSGVASTARPVVRSEL